VTARALLSPLSMSERDRVRAPRAEATRAQAAAAMARIRQKSPNWGIFLRAGGGLERGLRRKKGSAGTS